MAKVQNDGGIDAHRLMLFLGEDRIVGQQIVLFQECLSVSDLHIKKWITQSEKLVRHYDRERG